MQREILFRGFCQEDDGTDEIFIDGKIIKGRWVYGYYFKTYDEMNDNDGYSHYIIKLENDTVEGYCEFDDYCFEVIPETVSQYTGIDDKNGNKIFENDVVKCKTHNGHNNKIVKFNNGAFNVGEHSGSSTKITPMLVKSYMEILGNIFDNKDLLERK